jgi:hypothetical protein
MYPRCVSMLGAGVVGCASDLNLIGRWGGGDYRAMEYTWLPTRKSHSFRVDRGG